MRTGCFVQMFDDQGESFAEITTLKPECSFDMYVSYSSSEPQDMAVYLLENFAPVTYAAVPVSFGKNGEIAVGRVIYYQSGEKQFYIKLGEEIAPTEEEFQMVVFPYPYGFREDFNRTKRMELWSHLMMSLYLQKGE